MATITGLGGNDSILGTTGADLIRGLGGGDTLDGNSGNDTLLGGAGNDSLYGNAGIDSLFGGAGNDTLDAGDGQGIVETLDGGDGSDVFLITESGADNVVSLIGGAGVDRVVVSGNAVLQGFGPVDSIEIWEGGGRIVYGTTGANLLDFSATTLSGVAQINGDNGNDTIIGSAQADNIFGEDDADLLAGGGGNDTLNGGNGNDAIAGDDGNDRLTGSGGNDTLIGGLGNDTYNGGAGSDTIAWTATSFVGGDVAAGISESATGAAGDRLDFSAAIEGLLQQAGAALSSAAADVVIGATFAAGSTNVRFIDATDQLQIDIDGDGTFNAANDFQITLAGVTSVTYHASDDQFLLA